MARNKKARIVTTDTATISSNLPAPLNLMTIESVHAEAIAALNPETTIDTETVTMTEQHDAHVTDLVNAQCEATWELQHPESETVVLDTDVQPETVTMSTALDPAELEAIAAELELRETGPSLFSDSSESDPENTPVSDSEALPVLFEDLLQTFDDDKVVAMTNMIVGEIDEREAFEREKNPENDNIHRTLKKARAQLATKRTSQVLLAANVDPRFINRMLHDGSRFNVYSLGKLADIVRGVTDGTVTNAINQACLKSLVAFARAGEQFTGEMAKAAASDKIRVEPKYRGLLSRHTVAASTAPTQSNSTMQALETLQVVRNTGSRKSPVYAMTETPLAVKLKEMFTPQNAA